MKEKEIYLAYLSKHEKQIILLMIPNKKRMMAFEQKINLNLMKRYLKILWNCITIRIR